jgi:hypothetical protein
VEMLSPLTDYSATVLNERGRLELVRGDKCWADFRARWQVEAPLHSTVVPSPSRVAAPMAAPPARFGIAAIPELSFDFPGGKWEWCKKKKNGAISQTDSW